MFPSQMLHLKIVFLSNGPLHPYFPHIWYALKLFSSQIVHFIHVSLANGTPYAFIHVSLANGIVFLSNGPLYPCFPRKWYALKLFSSQMVHFIHVSLANGTP